MGKTWVLDTDTKGTGARMVPLESVQERPEPERPTRREPSRRARRGAAGEHSRPRKREEPRQKTSTQLPPGHVRKKRTGEIGRVQSVDPHGGTAQVRWLRGGTVSTVPLTAISRR
jgi:hypothetical protein